MCAQEKVRDGGRKMVKGKKREVQRAAEPQSDASSTMCRTTSQSTRTLRSVRSLGSVSSSVECERMSASSRAEPGSVQVV